jgi:Tfp pilus assembly protein PilX
MKQAKLQSGGFTLIASLLLLLLLSGMAIGLMMMVNTEGKVGGTDLQNNLAFHAAEGGIEKMFSDLSTTINAVQAPSIAEICAVNNLAPSITGVSFPYYAVQASGTSGTGSSATTVNCSSIASAQASTSPTANWGQITAGPDSGLYAQIMPISMTVTASMLGGQEVSMMRNAQIALIPVFQFGVFCEADCSFFSNPTLDFAGRLHANGDLYLGVSNSATLTFHDKLEAYGNVITNNLPNTLPASSNNDSGTVYVPSVSCAYPPSTNCGCPFPGKSESSGGWNCVQFPAADGSVSGMGGAPPVSLDNTSFDIATYASSYNTAFNTFSSSVNNEIINGDYGNTHSGQVGTSAKKLTLPFVSGTQHDYELIRRPPDQYLTAANVSDTAALSQSREYNLAQIHVLLSDDPNDLPGGSSDSQNVRLANLTATQLNAQNGVTTITTGVNPFGISISTSNYSTATWGTPASGYTYNLYFAAASNVVPVPSSCVSAASCSTPDWLYAPWPFSGQSSSQGLQPSNPHPTNSGAVNSPAYLMNDTTAFSYTTGTPATYPAITVCPPASPTPASIPANCPTTPGTYPYYAPPNPSTPVVSSALTPYNSARANSWSLIDGYLRVEYLNNSGAWVPVTQEWLQLGFARGVTPPTSPGTNPITPNAILLLQRPADRGASGSTTIPTEPTVSGGIWAVSQANTPVCTTTTGTGSSQRCTAWTAASTRPVPFLASDAGSGGQWAFGVTSTTALANQTTTPQSLTQYNWYPINFYDAREGEPRDVTTNQGNDSCTTNGVMNAVEIDVGNLKKWLAGTISGSGSSVNYSNQNGYVLYFSDRRGMLLNPHPPMSPTGGVSARSGDSGLEDVINADNAAGTPTDIAYSDSKNEGASEDTNQNGYIDTFGVANLGLGFYGTQASTSKNLNTQITSVTPYDPFGTATNARIASCSTTGRKNWVSGARHVLKLVDGSLGNLPATPVEVSVNGVSFYGGFTVASENPVYIHGDYNSSSSDTFFSGEANGVPGADNTSPAHVPAAVIADTVTFLSNNWNDDNSTILSPTQPGNPSNPNACPCNRGAAANTYYRVATAAGKTLTFPYPSSWETISNNYPEGTDGGIGNFLRFLEDWQDTPSTMHYGGSMVEMFYSTYNTGMFKCCTYSVYEPPNPRDYYFDPDFTTPQGLPPGTPMFRDVESLGYRQVLTARGLNNN